MPHNTYSQQLHPKIQQLQQLLAPFAAPSLQVFASPPKHYRMRAEFKIWHDHSTGQCHYAMYQPGPSRTTYCVSEFPPASKSINALMPRLLSAINSQQSLKHKLFQVDFLSSSLGQVLVSLIYHRSLDDSWLPCAQTLAQQLGIKIIGRSRGKKLVVSEDFVEEQFTVDQRVYRYKHSENAFTQPNAYACQAMLQWASNAAKTAAFEQPGDLLELYCGNGNFTLPLAAHFRRVLANEISKSATQDALYNSAVNAVANLQILRMSSEELTQALRGDRPFRRLEGISLADYHFRCVLVDPPRAGLDADTLAFIAQFPHIIYISCNPHSLADNLGSLQRTHRITAAALFDQFPYTEHIESGVVLVRR
jgi:tRNA (uracil-5-)-methyltransferase